MEPVIKNNPKNINDPSLFGSLFKNPKTKAKKKKKAAAQIEENKSISEQNKMMIKLTSKDGTSSSHAAGELYEAFKTEEFQPELELNSEKSYKVLSKQPSLTQVNASNSNLLKQILGSEP